MVELKNHNFHKSDNRILVTQFYEVIKKQTLCKEELKSNLNYCQKIKKCLKLR